MTAEAPGSWLATDPAFGDTKAADRGRRVRRDRRVGEALRMAGQLMLIRHGESQSFANGIYGCHQTCAGLTEAGRRQAELLGHRLAQLVEPANADVVFTSMLPRAIETATIALGVAGKELPLISDCGLCELHAGEADGLTREERLDRFGSPVSLIETPDEPIAPAGESWNGFLARAGAAIQRLVDQRRDQTTIVFTHAGVIGASVCQLGKLSPANLFTTVPPCTSITIWRWTDPGAPRLLAYGDAGHLSAELQYVGTPGFD